MSIQGSGKVPENIPAIARPALPPVAPRKPSVPVEPPAPPADQITLSSRAKQVQTLAAKVESVPEVRQERVSELSAQVKAKTYNVPAAKVAEKLLLEG